MNALNLFFIIFGLIFIVILIIIILTVVYNYIVYGSVNVVNSQQIQNRNVYINGELVYTCKSDNIVVINGKIYDNGVLVYKPKKRWQK